MCRLGALLELGAQPVDHQQRGDVAQPRLDRAQADQVAVELVEHLHHPALGQHLVDGAGRGGSLGRGGGRGAAVAVATPGMA
jgi:hypothetical protein